MYGWTGKILKVDLTTGRAWREDIPAELLHAYLGGRGLGVRLMRGEYRLDPFDPVEIAVPSGVVVGPGDARCPAVVGCEAERIRVGI